MKFIAAGFVLMTIAASLVGCAVQRGVTPLQQTAASVGGADMPLETKLTEAAKIKRTWSQLDPTASVVSDSAIQKQIGPSIVGLELT